MVSGDDNIEPSAANLRRSGRRVRHDSEVSDDAAKELRAGKRFVVVAHGRVDGTVMWFKQSRGSASKWLWVGMGNPPRYARVYLYSCHAGRKLPHYLRHCESFGHYDVVPMPVGHAKPVVLEYLDEVDSLVRGTEFDFKRWREHLGSFVNELFVREVENPTHYSNPGTLILLRESLGNVDS